MQPWSELRRRTSPKHALVDGVAVRYYSIDPKEYKRDNKQQLEDEAKTLDEGNLLAHFIEHQAFPYV